MTGHRDLYSVILHPFPRTFQWKSKNSLPFKSQFRDKYASRSPERNCCLNSVQLVCKRKTCLPFFHSFSYFCPPFLLSPVMHSFSLTINFFYSTQSISSTCPHPLQATILGFIVTYNIKEDWIKNTTINHIRSCCSGLGNL